MSADERSGSSPPYSRSVRQLDELGYVYLPKVLSPDVLQSLCQQVDELFRREGENAGSEFKTEPGAKRLANLVNKGRIFRPLLLHSDIFPLVKHVLDDRVKLSSLNARSANPHSETNQPLHCDMGAVPDEQGFWVCNVVWLLDDFTIDNGALRVVAGTHKSGILPADALFDTYAEHPQQELVTGQAGSAIVMNAHLWHAGTSNRTAHPRRAVHAFYCRRDKPQQQYQKALVDRDTQLELSPGLRELLALDDELNDRLSQMDVVRSGFMK